MIIIVGFLRAGVFFWFLVFWPWQVAISRNIDTQKQVANVDSQDLDLWGLHIFPPITILNFKSHMSFIAMFWMDL